MPLTPPGAAGALIPALAATGNVGIAVPQFALGIGTGVSLFAQSTVVTSVDTGTLGVGLTTVPLVMPQPVLLAGMLAGYAATGTIGVMAVPNATGVATGLALAFLQALVIIQHPSVGVGAGVAKFIATTGVPTMIAGFAAAGMVGVGSVKMATAIGIGLTIAFNSFVLPVPIVGSPSPAPGAGVGAGKIV